jgi:glycine cleavage system protein P-like pyridoxal-binding family
MIEITETMSRAEMLEWIEAMQKKNNDLWVAKVKAREAAKKKTRKKAG